MKVFELKKNVDERGSFTEIARQDWIHNPFGNTFQQANYAVRKAGTIVAWHKHERGQKDYFIFLSGRAHLAEKHENGEYEDIVVDATNGPTMMIEITGAFWHGFKALTDVALVYLTTRLYDYKNPDELRTPSEDSEWLSM